MRANAAAAMVALTVAALLGTGCASTSRVFPVVEVSPGIFEGPKPRTQGDFDALRAHGIRTILSLEQLPWDIYPERDHALENGIAYHNIPIPASPLAPSERVVKKALLTLSERSLRPVFVHCYKGQDRNVFIVGLYRMYYQGWSPEAAWAEMLRQGFHVRLTLRGFKTYFWSHTQTPPWVVRASESKPP